jgi:HlyD family secretion protein
MTFEELSFDVYLRKQRFEKYQPLAELIRPYRKITPYWKNTPYREEAEELMRAPKTRYILFMLVIGCAMALSACGSKLPVVSGAATPTVIPTVKADNSVMAEAKIVPIRSVNLTFMASGVVDEVLVKEGQTVKKDDVIARLSGKEQAQAAVSAAELALVSAQNAQKDLNDNADVARANAELKLAQAEKALDKATKNRTSRDYVWGDQNQIDLAWANYVALNDSVKTAEDNYSFVADRPEDDASRAYLLSVLAAARQKRDTALENYNFLIKKPDQLEVNQADSELKVAQANVEAAQLELDKVKDGPSPEDKALVDAQVNNAEAQVAAAKTAMDDLELKAPFDGTIVSMPLKPNEFNSPASGTPVILADTSVYKVETTDLTELNVVNIAVGSKAIVTVDALPDLELTGKVSEIKPLGEDRLGDVTYKVTIQLDKQDPRLRWNMTASASFEK